jgi:hypothetical protein
MLVPSKRTKFVIVEPADPDRFAWRLLDLPCQADVLWLLQNAWDLLRYHKKRGSHNNLYVWSLLYTLHQYRCCSPKIPSLLFCRHSIPSPSDLQIRIH